ncbi:MAG: hypothetical protein AB8H79_19560 [Myxococcota bacterium]
MRWLPPVLLCLCVGGCAESSLLMADGFVDSPGPDAGDLCLDAEPGLLTIESTPGVESSEILTVRFVANLEVCPVRNVYVDELTLDDPLGNFAIEPLDEPVFVDEVNPLELTLSLQADEVGSYPALLIIGGSSDAGTGGISVELRGQVVEAE